MRAPDLTGRVFADLRVIRRDTKRPGNRAYWIVACRCGSAPFSLLAHSLRSSHTTRCGKCAKAATPRKQGALHYGKTIKQWAEEEGVYANALYKRMKKRGTFRRSNDEPPIDPKAWPFPAWPDRNGVPTSPVLRAARDATMIEPSTRTTE